MAHARDEVVAVDVLKYGRTDFLRGPHVRSVARADSSFPFDEFLR